MPTLARGQMFVPGSFEVSDTGAATYTIPIEVPPGTAGMQPSLSLQYNSQGGNGLLGMGWSLTGLPTIARCQQTLAQDGVMTPIMFNSNDRYCLEGEHLFGVTGAYGQDGSTLGTERDGQSRITSHGQTGSCGPAWFSVQTKAGQYMQFGNSSDSAIVPQGQPCVRIWALNMVADSKGNYFTVTYTQDPSVGEYQPSRIDYGSNSTAGTAPYASVQFTYEPRPEAPPQYEGGFLIKAATNRLTHIRTYVGSTWTRDYGVTYQQSPITGRSRIAYVSLCPGPTGACVPATVLNWQDRAGSGTFLGTYSGQTASSSDWVDWPGVQQVSGDFNGDGITDVAVVATGLGGFGVYLGNGDGTFRGTYSGQTGSDWINWPGAKLVTGDFNGDGLTDIAVSANNLGGIGVYLSNGDGTFRPQFSNQTSTSSDWVDWPNSKLVTGDFNGDGLTDIAVSADNLGGFGVYLANGDGTFRGTYSGQTASSSDWVDWPNAKLVAGDFNGDGLTDIAVSADNLGGFGVYISTGNGNFNGMFSGQTASSSDWVDWPNSKLVAGDFNGDGLTDIAVSASNLGGFGVYISTGTGLFRGVFSGQTASSSDWVDWPNAKLVTGDFNGDGLTDVAVSASNLGGFGVYLANGDGTFHGTFSGQTASSSDWVDWPNSVLIAGDFNGDGLGDVAVSATNLGGFGVYLGAGGPSDLLATLTNGVGATTSISYLPITNRSVYAKDTTAAYPTQDIQAPLLVTARVTTSNGVGGSYVSTYTYAGAKRDLLGRGFLGFRQVTATDAQTGIVTTTTYQQAFPFTGLVASRTKALGTQILNSTANTYGCVFDYVSGSTCPPSSPGGHYFVSLQQSVAQSYDLNGAALPTVTTANQYDTYGNPTQVSVSTSDGFSKTSTNTYSNDTMNWFLGRLTAASVTSTTPQ